MAIEDHPFARLNFERVEMPTYIGRVVRWQGRVPWSHVPEVSASRDGVLVSGGWPIMTADALNDLREVLAMAEREWLSMRDKR